MLGGTLFLGPETVNAALARGQTRHTLQPRQDEPAALPDLEKLRGDRNSDVSALKGRAWDAVIDTSAYVPAHVKRVAEALGPDVPHYVLISTISVYPKLGETKEPTDEDTPVGTLKDETTEKVTGRRTGPLKALSEKRRRPRGPGASRTSVPG